MIFLYEAKVGYIEKGTTVLLNFYDMQRFKDIWGEDANQFNPEHFSTEATAARHPYAFLPFSGGMKICIGHHYAMTSMKVGLVSLLSQFKFTTDLREEDFKFNYAITMGLLNKHLVRANPRIWKKSL